MKKTRLTGIMLITTCAVLFFAISAAAQQAVEKKTPAIEKTDTAIKTPEAAKDEPLALESEKKDETAIAEVNTEDMTEIQAQGSSLFVTVKQGGPLMIFLILLALVALTIIIERLIFFTRNQVWKNEEVDVIISNAKKSSTARFREDLEDDLRGYYQVYVNGVERGLALLSGIGNIAPIVGFLGTVIGMIQAFASIAAATTVNAKVVAVGIQIALVTTAAGLIVAAPTLAFYYLFTHVLQNRYSRMEELITGAIDEKPRLSDRICEEGSNE